MIDSYKRKKKECTFHYNYTSIFYSISRLLFLFMINPATFFFPVLHAFVLVAYNSTQRHNLFIHIHMHDGCMFFLYLRGYPDFHFVSSDQPRGRFRIFGNRVELGHVLFSSDQKNLCESLDDQCESNPEPYLQLQAVHHHQTNSSWLHVSVLPSLKS